MNNDNLVIGEVKAWLQNVVIGLNLCPFAAKPSIENRIQFKLCSATSNEEILADLETVFIELDETPVEKLETSLLILTDYLQDFYDYNDFLAWVDRLIIALDREGVYQVASFHPHYCFAGAQPDDAENLTNRAPYPILHILREDSLAAAIDHYPNVSEIPERNIKRVESLSAEEKKQLFRYLGI